MQCLIRAENFEETLQNIAVTPGLNGNAEANAAFIVRACNNHEKLLELVKDFGRANPELDDDNAEIPGAELVQYAAEWWRRAQDIIAAAEGR